MFGPWNTKKDVRQSAIRLLFLAIIVSCVIGIFTTLVSFEIDRTRHQSVCVNHGYPDLLYSEMKPYCHRLENGNDMIVSVESLKDE